MKKEIDYFKDAGVSDKFISPYHIKAMKEYAKQSILDFEDWKHRYGIRFTLDGYIQNSDKKPFVCDTTEDLFNVYIEYKSKHE